MEVVLKSKDYLNIANDPKLSMLIKGGKVALTF